MSMDNHFPNEDPCWSNPNQQIDPQLIGQDSRAGQLNRVESPQIGLPPPQLDQSLDLEQSSSLCESVNPLELQGGNEQPSSWDDLHVATTYNDWPEGPLFDTCFAFATSGNESHETDDVSSTSNAADYDSSDARADNETTESTAATTNTTESSAADGDNLSNLAYAKILHECLSTTAPAYEMQLQKIYEWFRINTHRGRTSADSKAWKNSIRHNLSMNNGFVSGSRTSGKAGKKYMWRLSEEVIAAGKIQPTTRFRRDLRKVQRRTSDAGPPTVKQLSGSKGGQATRQSTRKNPPREVRPQPKSFLSSPSPSVAPVSVYSPAFSTPSSFGTSGCVGGSTPEFSFSPSTSSTPLTQHGHLGAVSPYASPYFSSHLMPAPTSAPFITPPLQGPNAAPDTPTFQFPQAPDLSSSPAPIYQTQYPPQPPCITVDDTSKFQPSEPSDQFAAFNGSETPHPSFGYDMFDTGVAWNPDFSFM